MKKTLLLFVILALSLKCSKKDDDIQRVEGAPIAVDDSTTTPNNRSVVIDVLLNDEAGDNPLDPSSVIIENAVSHGTTEINPVTGAIKYTPNSTFIGVDTFTYKVCDNSSNALCDSANVTINVTNRGGDGTPPCQMVENFTATYTSDSITVSWNPCVDPNGEEVTYLLTFLKEGYDCYFDGIYDMYWLDFTTTENSFTFTNANTDNKLQLFHRYYINIRGQDPSGSTSDPNLISVNFMPIGTLNQDIILRHQYAVDLFEGHQIDVVNGEIYTYEPCMDFGIPTSSPIIDLSPLTGIKEINGDVILKSFGLHQFHTLKGFEEVTKITGKLRIEGKYDRTFVNDVSQLSNLTELGGFEMVGSTISSINGMNNLQFLNGNFYLENNLRLNEIVGFNNLQTINGNINFNGQNLGTINGFDNLTNINGFLSLSSCLGTGTLSGFNNLNTIQGDFRIENTKFSSIDGFQNLVNIWGDLYFAANESTNIPLFNSLTSSFNGDIYITHNTQLQSVSGFSNLSSVSKDLIIYNNGITSLSGFSNLTSVTGNLTISNLNLSSLTGFTNLSSIEKSLDVSYNSFNTIEGLNNLNTVGENISLLLNNNLTNIDFLVALSFIGENLVINNNQSLLNIDGISNLDRIEGGIDILYNDSLSYLSFSPFTATSDFYLKIVNNNALSSISGFPNASSIKSVDISRNPSLNNLNGLLDLTTIQDFLILDDNDSITNLDFLLNLILIECGVGSNNDLTITNNFYLGDFCGLRDFFTNGGLCSGNYVITGNGFNPTALQIINGDCSL
jgi:hypothetical protein